MMQDRIIAINNIIKIKNPSLIHQINKAPNKFNIFSKSNNSSIMKKLILKNKLLNFILIYIILFY